MPKELNQQCNFFAKIPNNEEGRFFLFLLDKYLNKRSYLVKKRGRQPNHKLMKEAGLDLKRTKFWQHVPEKYAQAFNIYLCVRRKNMCPDIIGISTYVYLERKQREYNELQENFNQFIAKHEVMETDYKRLLELEEERKSGFVEGSDMKPRYQHLERE